MTDKKIPPSPTSEVGYRAIAAGLLMLILTVFLLANIIQSQTISSIFFPMVNGYRLSAVEFLKKIRRESIFASELKKFQNIYGKSIEDEVFYEERKRNQIIKNLEQILEKNPQARDVLYSLYLLTNDQKYLQRAKAVDPNISN